MIAWISWIAIAITLFRLDKLWPELGLYLFGYLALGVGALLLFDWVVARTKHWTQELGHARIYWVKELALAIKGMSPMGLDFLRAKTMTEIDLITGPDDEPTLMNVVCIGGRVPVEFIDDLLKASEHSWPFLVPVREVRKLEQFDRWGSQEAEELASRMTHKLIDDDIADPFKGRYAARVKDKYSLEYVRRKYHVV